MLAQNYIGLLAPYTHLSTEIKNINSLKTFSNQLKKWMEILENID